MSIVPKKCIHLALISETHAGLKRASCDLHMTMQSIVEELVELVVSGDPYVMGRLKDVIRRRRECELVPLYATDAESLLDEIELVAEVNARLERKQKNNKNEEIQ
jgi:hypothetical protein